MAIEAFTVEPDLAGALLAAQRSRDAHAEADAISRFYIPRRRRCNSRTASILDGFFSRIAFGATACWYWTGHRNEGGYGVFAAARRRLDFPEILAHRIAWHLFNGPIPPLSKVLHRCDVPACVNAVEHLFLGTQADNVADMFAKGRNRSGPRFGSANPMSALTEDTVRAMRADYASGAFSQQALALRYGVSVMTVNRAVRKISWSHI